MDNKTIEFDKETFSLRSTVGLSLIELRSGETEQVEKWWEFSNKTHLHNFTVPISYRHNEKFSIIFAIDISGAIIKEMIL